MATEEKPDTSQPDESDWTEVSAAKDALGRAVEGGEAEKTKEIEAETGAETGAEAEVPIPQTTPDDTETDTAAERSRLGRKVKSLHEAMEGQGKILQSLQETLTRMEKGVKPSVTGDESGGGDEISSIIEKLNAGSATKGDFEKIFKTMLTGFHGKADAEKQRYNHDYIGYLTSVEADADPTYHDAIIKELETGHNIYRTGNGKVDAELNYKAAETAFLKKQLKKKALPVNPLKKNDGKETSPLGAPVSGDVKGKGAVPITLDDKSKAFVAALGMDEEEIEKALSDPIPMHLQERQ